MLACAFSEFWLMLLGGRALKWQMYVHIKIYCGEQAIFQDFVHVSNGGRCWRIGTLGDNFYKKDLFVTLRLLFYLKVLSCKYV